MTNKPARTPQACTTLEGTLKLLLEHEEGRVQTEMLPVCSSVGGAAGPSQSLASQM